MERIPYPVRINRYLALKNYCPRRAATQLVKDGQVYINGRKAVVYDMVSEADEVVVDGPVREKPYTYLAYYKPKGIVTIGAQGSEREIADVQTFPQGTFPLGRLDKESEGLLIITDDGRITEPLLSPTHAHEKEYRVTVEKPISHQFLVRMKQGVPITKKHTTRPAKVRKVGEKTFDIILTEGKNRQIRKMCGALGYGVRSLKRFRILNITLSDLKPNEYRPITNQEKETFLQSLI